MQEDEGTQLDEEASLGEKENAKAWNGNTNNSSTNRVIKLTKPRARVFSTYEVIKFEEKEVQRMGPKNGVKKKKAGKRIKHTIKEDATRKKREELQWAYKRKVHAYKTKYKPQKIKSEFPMQHNEET